MTFIHGKDTRVVLDQFNVSPFLNSMDLGRDRDNPETTVFGNDGNRTYIAGLRNASISMSGFFDGANNAIDQVLHDTLEADTAKTIMAAPIGFAVGNLVYLFQAHPSTYAPTSPVDGVVAFSSDLNGTGRVDRGFSLHQLTAETTTANGSSVDNGASTANGGLGQLHVTAVSGTTPTLDVIIQDSPNGTTYAAFITFTQVTTTPSFQRILQTGTVDRHVRAMWTIAGMTPSYTFTVGFARR